MAKSELEIVSKMLRYKAEVEDKSYPRVVVRQLCDAVLGHNRDAVELIRQALDNQITMQDMIVRSCGMMSMYADRLDMDSTRRLIAYLEWRGDYRDTNYTGTVDMYGYVQSKWDDLADYVLGHFTKEEQAIFAERFDEVYDAVQLIVMGDITEAMNRHNKKK